jgi:FkbM family methyltransferase
MLKERVKALARLAGYDVHRRDLSHPARRAAAMAVRGVDVVLDVGANEGQYVGKLREFGYRGRIVSFEPFAESFEILVSRLSHDAQWQGVNVALGSQEGVGELQVARSTLTSSLLPARDELRSVISGAEAVSSVAVPIVALDDVWDDYVSPSETALLKIDVQGYEHSVLDGGRICLRRVPLIEVEMGLVELYEGGSTVHDLLPRLRDQGFSVISIDAGFVDAASGQVLDVDVLLGRPLT